MILLLRRAKSALTLVALAGLPACAGGTIASTSTAGPPGSAPPQTRAERSGYTETSRHADVIAFLDSLQALGAPIHLDTLGVSTEGRAIPLVIASRPRVRTPEEARRLGRPVVYVQGNIHGGEVEGKEALLALLRDLSLARGPNVLDSLVLLAVPIYNADGNERFAPQSVNRTEQNGPEQVGERANGQGLDLNRDYVKAEAPETRAALRRFGAWDPDVFVDLHTTDGSYHGYALTYSPSLNPAAGVWTRERLLPELRRRVRDRHGFETFDYGNFSREYGADVNTDSVREGWYSYDARPRFGTNYYGLRGGISVLTEAFSHDPFRRRIASTRAFVSELLSLVAERGREVRTLAGATEAGPSGPVPIRSRLTPTPYTGEVLAEVLAPDPDSVPDEPGVHRGIRRTGRFRALRIPVYDRFAPTLSVAPPAAYLLPPSDTAAVGLLRLHGVRVDRVRAPTMVQGEAFVVDSVIRAERPFQGHREARLEGRWRPVERTVPAGWYRVPTDQPLGTLAVYLLEPQSEDGLVTWNVLGGGILPGAEFPVLRISETGRGSP